MTNNVNETAKRNGSAQKPWLGLDLDDPGIPSMITPEERSYLYWLSSQVWTGSGHIVEIGPWLGGSTYCLARGLRDNACRSDKVIHTFDNFKWCDFMGQRAALPLGPGDSFEQYFHQNMVGFEDVVVAHRQWLPDNVFGADHEFYAQDKDDSAKNRIAWTVGEPVEILFIDGAKSWNAFRYLLWEFCEFLQPGKTLLVCQDYKYWGEYWVALCLEYLAEFFEMCHNLTVNSVSFRLRRPLRREDVARLPDLDQVSVEKGLGHLDRAAARFKASSDRLGGLIMQTTKVRFLAHKADVPAAVAAFRKIEGRWPLTAADNNLERVRCWLAEKQGGPLPRSLRSQLRRVVRRLA